MRRFSSDALLRHSAQTARLTHLRNGIRVVTEDSQGHFVGVGVFVDAGSRYESPSQLGLSHFLDRMSFKSTREKSREQVTSAIENMGSMFMTASTRESMSYQANIFRHHLPQTVELLAENIRYPLLTADEIKETKSLILYELQQSFEKPDWLLPELAHQTAYRDNTLGLPQVCIPENIDGIDVRRLEAYRNVFFQPSRFVVAGVGVEHALLCELTDKYLGDMKGDIVASSQAVTKQPAVYTGGLHSQQDDNLTHTHMFLGFESVDFNHPDVYALSVLQVMLGGGDSFSAGGPGKGMYSRLYTNVLNQYYWVEKVLASNQSYVDTGLFGFHCAVPPQAMGKMLDVLAMEIVRLVNDPLSVEELERAKNQLRSSVFMNLESKMVHLEDVGRQIQMRGKRTAPAEISSLIGQVTEKDLKRVIRRLIESPPTFCVLGDTRNVPSLARFQKILSLGIK